MNIEYLTHRAAIEELHRLAGVLRTFYRATLSIGSLQPVLDLAVELNPDLAAPAILRAPVPADLSAAPSTTRRAACSHLGATEAV